MAEERKKINGDFISEKWSSVVPLRAKIRWCSCKLPLFLALVLVNIVAIVTIYILLNTYHSIPGAKVSHDESDLESLDDRDRLPQADNLTQSKHEKLPVFPVTTILNTNLHHLASLQQQQQQLQDRLIESLESLDCEVILLWSDENSLTHPGSSEDITRPEGIRDPQVIVRGDISEQRGRNQQPGNSLDSHNVSRWCGRDVQPSYTSESSFTSLSGWLASGGINIIYLLHQSILPCSLQCPSLSSGPPDVNEAYSRELNAQPSQDMASSRLTTFEANILKSVRLIVDKRLVSDEKTSHVVITSSRKHLKIGDVISLRVDIYDGYGNAKKEGGDEVRVWISDPSMVAGSPGMVSDLTNGSYAANVTVRWGGSQKITVALHHPREIMRTMIFLRHTLGTMRYLTSAFENGIHGEVTPCMWYPVIPGYDDFCNLTSMNGGLPWFCGRPISNNLTCANWVRAQSSEFVAPLPVTRAEQIWLNKMSREPYIRTIPFRDSIFKVTIEANLSMHRDPCWQVPHADTWKQDTPSGWFFKQKWRSANCDIQDLTIEATRSWLRNKSVYLLGDSNMKNLFKVMRRDFCTMHAPTELPFPGPMNCSDPDLGIHVHFRAHAHPFNLPHPDHFREYNKPLSSWLDLIQPDEDVLVVCHLYLHFSQFTLPLYVLHVQDLLRGVNRLLDRNPHARVVIRGTHVAYKGWPVHAAGGDVLAFQFNQILRQEFTALHHQLMFLNGWDMTLAIANLNFHPESHVNEAMINQVFNHFIGRS